MQIFLHVQGLENLTYLSHHYKLLLINKENKIFAVNSLSFIAINTMNGHYLRAKKKKSTLEKKKSNSYVRRLHIRYNIMNCIEYIMNKFKSIKMQYVTIKSYTRLLRGGLTKLSAF